ncbi:hypothetical protein G7046_g40 [Stylonectria norvegica]|nr:hypothetical protein G7046_g40 [Stylonectria norvegica]
MGDSELYVGGDPRQPLEIPSNPYATSYASTWTIPESGLLTAKELEVIQHVNCSYLSSERAPTLLALKQHAQSLVSLIRRLSISTDSRPIDGLGGRSAETELMTDHGQHEAFDWLNKLNIPYENGDESHHLPLWALANIVESESESDGIQHHCPLKEARDFGPLAPEDGLRRPYQTHHSLAMHANECLEILDHEYSASGGLLSLLPSSHEFDTDQLAGVRNTLLGQWLMHHQHLIGRMHELEINYANALDLLAGEAHVPQQVMRTIGPDGLSKGREIAYPQDKFILANAGDDVQGLLHRLMDKAEGQIEQKEKIWKASGVGGERMWHENRGGAWYARGLVPVDMLTRFYRIKGKGHGSTIFVMPAIEQHPGVAHTRKMEQRPTVVSVVTPTWPERVSEWETKFKEQLDRAKETEIVNRNLVREKIEIQDVLAVRNAELRKKGAELAYFRKSLAKDGRERERELIAELGMYKGIVEDLKRVLPKEYQGLLQLNEEEDDE